MIIDHDDYDKILINLLQSYQEFKQKLNDMKELQQIEEDNIANSKEAIEDTKRKPMKIKNFFHKIFEKMRGKYSIEDVHLDVD